MNTRRRTDLQVGYLLAARAASFLALTVVAIPVHAATVDTRKPAIFSLHIGVNVAPAESGLAALRYADDDAVRFFAFIGRTSRRSELLSVLDPDTRRRHASLWHLARPPRRSEIEAAIDSLNVEMQQARQEGAKVVFVLSYSGHGVANANGVELSLLDGTLDKEFFSQRIAALPADVVHLFIDACHGEGLLAARGIKGEREGSAHQLNQGQADRAFGRDFFARNPHVGAIFSSTQESESHEWSLLEAGLFTYELLSGLHGAADINLDGQIAYSEIAAFIAAANNGVDDPRAVLNLVVESPRLAGLNTIVNSAWFGSKAPLLVAKNSTLGHFYLERDDGLRLLDVNVASGTALSLLLPSSRGTYVHTARGDEAYLLPRQGARVELSTLGFRPAEHREARGASEQALKRGLFKTPLSREFYAGYIANSQLTSVDFATTPTDQALTVAPARNGTAVPTKTQRAAPSKRSRSIDREQQSEPEPVAAFGEEPADATWSWILGSSAAACGVGSGVAGVMSFIAYTEYVATPWQRQASDALTRSILFGVLTGVGVIGTSGLALLTLVALPSE